MSDQIPSGNPFDRPPSGPTVPLSPITPHRSPWKPAAAGFGAAVLLGAGVFGITRLGSDEVDAASTSDRLPAPAQVTTVPAPTVPAAPTTTAPPASATPEATGEPSSRPAAGELPPVGVPDLGGMFGPLSDCLGIDLDALGLDEMIADLTEQFGSLPPVSIPDFGEWGEFGDWEGWSDGAVTVTVTGPDGVEMYTIDGDGTVTVTAEDGTVTVVTDGDATETDFGRWFDLDHAGDWPTDGIPPISIPDFGDLDLGEFDLDDLNLDDLNLDDLNLGELDLGQFDVGRLGECFAEPAG